MKCDLYDSILGTRSLKTLSFDEDEMGVLSLFFGYSGFVSHCICLFLVKTQKGNKKQFVPICENHLCQFVEEDLCPNLGIKKTA